jgi:hypothetical protein
VAHEDVVMLDDATAASTVRTARRCDVWVAVIFAPNRRAIEVALR